MSLKHEFARAAACRSRAAVLALLLAIPAGSNAQMFAHRTMIAVPLDDTTRKVGLLAGVSYFADVERASRSAGDDRAWDARLAGTIEVWRFSPATSLVIATADELVANSLKDAGFNPRGISWELSIGAVHRFGPVTAELGFVHYCRHAIDNLDPPGPEYYIPGYVGSQRTMSANGPRLRLISPLIHMGNRISVRGALAGERYQQQWDGRRLQGQPGMDSGINSWKAARGSASADLRVEADVGRGSSVFIRSSGNAVFFDGSSANPVTSRAFANRRIELGWRARGGGGSIELYGAVERLFDDLSEITPRSSSVIGIGLRLSDRSQF